MGYMGFLDFFLMGKKIRLFLTISEANKRQFDNVFFSSNFQRF